MTGLYSPEHFLRTNHMEVKQFKAFAECGWCNIFQHMKYRCVLLSNMIILSVSCTDGDNRVHEDFITVMVLLSINTSDSSLQSRSITGWCVSGTSVHTMLPVSISFQEQSLTNYSHLARSTEETNMTNVNGSFNHWLSKDALVCLNAAVPHRYLLANEVTCGCNCTSFSSTAHGRVRVRSTHVSSG
jgi:hypothetical protein